MEERGWRIEGGGWRREGKDEGSLDGGSMERYLAPSVGVALTSILAHPRSPHTTERSFPYIPFPSLPSPRRGRHSVAQGVNPGFS